MQCHNKYLFIVDPSSIQRFYVDGFENARIITINQSQTVILFCEAYSDPVANMFLINNTRNGRDLLTETHNNTISVSLENARCEFDKGIYKCQGNNIHNAAQQVREKEIIIRCKSILSNIRICVMNMNVCDKAYINKCCISLFAIKLVSSYVTSYLLKVHRELLHLCLRYLKFGRKLTVV